MSNDIYRIVAENAIYAHLSKLPKIVDRNDGIKIFSRDELEKIQKIQDSILKSFLDAIV